ncbi:MAG: cyclic nucleotide-binding domain-containing protein [Gammaproteobacteria bacterium]|nr:cyclic nucleotide-binding domain-containing protein [Gammaproteobacteria bacterium]NIM74068.1 cyclic nucleotide-binding domain-containing protein [Gammaproteobacteria bacterium]NIN38951.1 cyclic nucleotide-binding domain-containing protein [Gammaproteobacteria bacterium]NIO25844.1 cyclic nucleotide-binding domain-containing protein [Gammaproteobacteria bacterium]NIO66475.1 cyclic nucleotide-binding domain-containing protein [Gammaproteobacteria bacterium]
MTDNVDKVKALSRAELFQGVDDETLEEIAQLGELKTCEEGDVIYQLGDDAHDVYVLVSGRVRFTLGVGNRSQSSGSIMSGRMVFGWAALVDDQPRRVATAECLEDSIVLVVSGERLLEILEAHPQAGFVVMRRLSAMIARNFMDVGAS